MIRHLVFWDLKADVDGRSAADNAKLLKEQGEAMAGKIPSLLSIEVSYSFLPSSTVPAGVILHSTHADVEGMKAYAEHPIHLEFAKLVKATTENRRAIDYEF